MKNKSIFKAAIAAVGVAGIITIARSTHAAAPDTTAPNAMTATAGTTTNSADEMAALFGDPVIASGKGVEVKRSAMDKLVTSVKAAAAQSGETVTPDRLELIEAQQLEQMIDLQLLLQNATDVDKAVGAKDANDEMAALLKQFGTQDELDMRLTAAGTTETELRKKFADQSTAMATLQRELGVTVTDAEVQKFYEDHPQKFEEPEMVHVRHILLMTIDPSTGEPLADDVVQAKHKQAESVLAKARAGNDFAKLAEEYSDDTTTKFKGGDLPAFPRASADPRHAMLPEFEAAAFSLTNNQISDLVETRYGYHIIQLIEKVPAKKLTLADKVPQNDMTVADAVKDGLKRDKTSEKAPAYMEQLKKAADVKILDPDLSAAVTELNAMSATNAAAPSATSEQAAPAAQSN